MLESENIYLGLGSNQGDREQLMAQAIELLSVALGAPVSLSSTIETEAWGFVSPNPFLNMVACFSTDVPPMELLQITEDVERRLGRKTKSVGGVYSDRPIDIDILFYGDKIISTERLTVPHPRLHERLFVLAPLAEIAPHLVHPLLGKSVSQLRDSILSAPDSNV